eukprot:Tbor_TRINITY_DN1254_c0_g1::TRINITY_DN1254_c0_g1_i1::g.5731::m.5731/K02183/CALM; calmodulin
MADLLSIEQIAQLKEAFSVFDKEGGGSISVQDLKDVFRNMGQSITIEDATRMIEEADLDANGVVDFPEFLTMIATDSQAYQITQNPNKEMMSLFSQYDLSHTGYITASNLQYIMGKMGCRLTAEEADEMIREADVDGDGRLNFDDFRRIMGVAVKW